ncbi:hypothetical protein Sjap_007272 [Stephania japonica]|uniref:Smr domain-containing protein n=1 Tax=Stephania japonica TaxID=461633 RepID=A0AAP0JMC6_9MAGN
MASSTSPHCSITATTKSGPQNHHHHQHQHQQHWKTKSELSPDFCGRRSTRLVSKIHVGRPKSSQNPSRHSSAASAALDAARHADDSGSLVSVLHSFNGKLSGSDDYSYLLRELGNRGECWKALCCFEFAIERERKRSEQGKLASAMISVLGRLGRVDLARSVFDAANAGGYGNTVYAFSAMVNAYGRGGFWDQALRVFVSMKDLGLTPNLVTYNAVIDACAKGGADFTRALEFFDEMVRNGVHPDRITFNSLLAVCGRSGLWQDANNLFHEMVFRGIHQDIFTYNTLLDAVCKGGQMDLAFQIMSGMPSKGVWPNVVTYSTVIDGCAKAGKLEEALNLFEEMKLLGIRLDRISYNTLLAVYASLGRFEEALDVCREMEASGIRKDVVTYNALMGGYGKQGNYCEVQKLFREMKAENLSPNLLTYSTLIDVYSKGGMYLEAMEIFKELKQAGLEIDVVLYSSLIDALCKNGLVESAVSLLDEMTKKGIRPNVVTYNSIIDAFGRSAVALSQEGSLNGANGTSDESLTSMVPRGISGSKEGDKGDDNKVMKLFAQLAAEKACPSREDTSRKSKEILCVLELFKKMHELKIKPNVVTFSAILNACSRCNSFEDASMLLEELRLFDNQVYGVAHGLLKGGRENVWLQAQCLFDEVKRMDSSTASAFYNALTDMLWHFGQKRGAQLVVLEGKRRQVWENVWSDSCLDLHLMSSGAAQAMVHAWLLNIRAIVYEGHELPKLLRLKHSSFSSIPCSILTGWGKHSKVAGDGTLRRVVEALLIRMGAPFHVAKCNIGRFISTGAVVTAWLRESGTLNVLILHDDRTDSELAGVEQQGSNVHILSL